jgi:hypothetical protein
MDAMAETRVPPRPRQVTFAGIAAATTCAVLVLVLFEQMTQVHSIQTRQAVADALSQPPFKGSGIGIGQALGVLHAIVLLSGALAAAGCVLGVFALLRHRGARLGLTVVAVLLVVTSLFLTGLLPVIVAAAAGVLWTPQARAWFDGRAYERPTPSARVAARPGPATPTHRSSVDPSWAPPAAARRAAPAVLPAVPPSVPRAIPDAAGPGRRPAVVVAALVLTWVVSGLVAAAVVARMVAGLVDKTSLFEQVQRDDQAGRLGHDPNAVLGTLLVVGVLLVLWCLAAAGLGIAAYQRVESARIALLVSAGLSAVFSLVALLGTLAALVPLAGSVAVVVLLLLPAARSWFHPGRPPRSSGRVPQGRPPVW